MQDAEIGRFRTGDRWTHWPSHRAAAATRAAARRACAWPCGQHGRFARHVRSTRSSVGGTPAAHRCGGGLEPAEAPPWTHVQRIATDPFVCAGRGDGAFGLRPPFRAGARVYPPAGLPRQRDAARRAAGERPVKRIDEMTAAGITPDTVGFQPASEAGGSGSGTEGSARSMARSRDQGSDRLLRDRANAVDGRGAAGHPALAGVARQGCEDRPRRGSDRATSDHGRRLTTWRRARIRLAAPPLMRGAPIRQTRCT